MSDKELSQLDQLQLCLDLVMAQVCSLAAALHSHIGMTEKQSLDLSNSALDLGHNQFKRRLNEVQK